MMPAEAVEQTFLSHLEEMYASMSGTGTLKRMRQQAWDRFLQLGLPTRKWEAFRYMKLSAMQKLAFTKSEEAHADPKAIQGAIFPECEKSCLVFVNGRFNAALSRLEGIPKKVVIKPLNEAVNAFGAFLQNSWKRMLKEEADPFVLLNAALHEDGIFLYIPPGTVLEAPIQILHVNDAAGAWISPRIHGVIGKGAQLDFIFNEQRASDESFGLNQVIELGIEENAHVRLVHDLIQMPETLWQFHAIRATLKRDATLRTYGATEGSASVRQDFQVALTGENAEALLQGLWMLEQKNEAHTHVYIDHQAPHCHSLQLFKGVLNDASHSSFEGKIMVRQEAQKTDAFQLNNNLLLNDHARAESKPNLEIFADDVKASHGSTVGKLDAEQLFYMRSRGFSEEEAKNLLVHSYCQEVIDAIPVASVKKRLSQEARQMYHVPN